MDARVPLSLLALSLLFVLSTGCSSGDSSSVPGEGSSTGQVDETSSVPTTPGGTSPSTSSGTSSSTTASETPHGGSTSSGSSSTSEGPGSSSSSSSEPSTSDPTPPAAPDNLQATDGTRADAVALSWDPVDDAEGYHVYVGEDRITESPLTETSWLDTEAEAGSEPGAIEAIAATDDRSDGVQLSWNEAAGTPGASRTYRVRAIAGALESPLSEPAEGRRGPEEVSDYEVLIDGTWTSIGGDTTPTANGLAWLDTDAPLRTLEVARPQASTDDPDRITVTGEPANVADGGHRTYALRALSASGAGDPSETTSGRRAAGPLDYTWESAALGSDTWQPIDADPADPLRVVDEDVTAGTSLRYRVTASAEGAEDATSPVATGTRFAPGAPENVSADQGVSSSTVAVTWDPVDDATGYLVYRDGVLVTPTAIGASSTPEWVDNTPPAPPLPPAILNLNASDERSDGVALSWDPVEAADGDEAVYQVQTEFAATSSGLSAGATGWTAALPVSGYELRSGETLVTSVPQPANLDHALTYLDAEAPLRLLDVPTPTASDDDLDGVSVSVGEVAVVAGQTRTYQVVAISNAGESPEGPGATGARSVGAYTYGWQWQPEGGGTWLAIGPDADTFFDDALAVGETRRYRVQISAAGAESAVSETTTGTRFAPVPLPAPEDLSATQGTDTEAVHLSWNPVENAETYTIYRENGEGLEVLAEGVASTTWSHAAAPAGGVPTAPELDVLEPAIPEGVDLAWSGATAPAGDTVTYVVQAMSSDERSAPGDLSASAEGFRAPYPILGYEVLVCSPGCTPLPGLVEGANWRDEDAPLRDLDVPRPQATTDDPDRVVVTGSPADAAPGGLRTWAVRAVNDAGAGAQSDTQSGQRAIGTLAYTWEWAPVDGSGSWQAIAAVAGDALRVEDEVIAQGSSRRYRVTASAPGAQASTSEVATGTRFAPGAPSNVNASQAESTSSIRVTWDPVEDATGYHVYRDGERITTAPIAPSSTPEWMDEDAPAPPVPPTVDTVEASTDRSDGVFVAWQPVEAGTGPPTEYQVQSTFPTADSGLSESATGWTDALPVTGYEMRSGDTLIANLPQPEDTSGTIGHLDDDAPLRALDLPTPTASDDDLDGVGVALGSVATRPGDDRAYHVVAINDSGASLPAEAVTGSRSVATFSWAWEWQAEEGGAWSAIGPDADSFFDDSLAVGETRRYRVGVSAAGAEAALSETATGTRFAPVPLSAPDSLVATQGTDSDAVHLSWSSVQGAESWTVWRVTEGEPELLAEGLTERTWSHTGAPAGGAPAAPVLSVVEPASAGGVDLAWTVPSAPAGASVTYVVQAFSTDPRTAPGELSDPASGFRAALPILGYEMEACTAPGSCETISGLIGGQSWRDEDAPLRTLTLPAPTASTDRYDGVDLAIAEHSLAEGGTRTYRVHARNAAGAGAPSETTEGARGVGSVAWQWEFSAADAGSYSDLAGATARAANDTTIPVGQSRDYRVRATAEGAEVAISVEVRGTRRQLMPPSFVHASTNSPTRVTVEWQRVDGATEYQVFRDGDQVATVPATEERISVETWEDTNAPAPPAPPQVQDVATSGSPEGVEVTWTPVTPEGGESASYQVVALTHGQESALSGAASGFRSAPPVVYDMQVGPQIVAEVSGPPWLHEDSPLRQISVPNPTATTTLTARVDLEIGNISVTSTPTRAYRVIARSDAGSGTVSGFSMGVRTIGPPAYTWYQRSPGTTQWNALGLVGNAVSDTDIPPGESREYRVEVTAQGAETAHSSVATGTRLQAAQLGELCTENADCVENAWCPTDTLPELRRCSPAPDLDGAVGEILFQYVPPGDFVRGSSPFETGRGDDEGERHTILTRGVFIQRAPVTQAQWAEVAAEVDGSWGTAPSFRSSCPECPVESVNRLDAMLFANVLSEREGLEPCYNIGTCQGIPGGGCPGLINPANRQSSCIGVLCNNVSFVGVSCTGYRLPTEAEWEYAARAGTEEMAWTGDFLVDDCSQSLPVLGDIAWYACRSFPEGLERTQPVEGLSGNPWGLFDMLGNVEEWVEDTYLGNYIGVLNPLRQGDTSRVSRGASFRDESADLRAAMRRSRGGPTRRYDLGFRLARTLLEPEGVSCPELEFTPDGVLVVSVGGSFFGATAEHFCNQLDIDNPVMRTGPELRACMANGEWSGTDTTCVPLDCGVPRTPSNVNFSLDGSGTGYQDTATFACGAGYSVGEPNEGFSVNPQMGGTLRCMEHLQFSGAPQWRQEDDSLFPGCHPMDCGDLHAPENGTVDYDHTFLGAVATYACDENWELGGDDIRVCTAQGWSGTRPNCGCTSNTQCGSGQSCSLDADASVRRCAQGIALPSANWFEVGMRFVHIPPGHYMRGSPPGEPGRIGHESVQPIVLTRAFEMLDTEVLQAHWRDFATGLGYTWKPDPSFNHGGSANKPVESVSPVEAYAFANALSAAHGLSPCYLLTSCTGTVGHCQREWNEFNQIYRCTGLGSNSFHCESEASVSPHNCTGYRLPTSAEWEYAARAGTTTATWNGTVPTELINECDVEIPLLSSIANYCWSGAGTGTLPSRGLGATLDPNPWGLFSIIGNVREFPGQRSRGSGGVDPFSSFSLTSTPRNAYSQGGGWRDTPQRQRAAAGAFDQQTFLVTDDQTGFRLARTLPLDPDVNCNFPPLPENGGVDLSDGPATYGDEAQYFCAEGYTLSQTLPVVCASNGEWVGFPPTCDP